MSTILLLADGVELTVGSEVVFSVELVSGKDCVPDSNVVSESSVGVFSVEVSELVSVHTVGSFSSA